MDRLKREYEEEMRVRNEIAELNSKFKIENDASRAPKPNSSSKPPTGQITDQRGDNQFK